MQVFPIRTIPIITAIAWQTWGWAVLVILQGGAYEDAYAHEASQAHAQYHHILECVCAHDPAQVKCSTHHILTPPFICFICLTKRTHPTMDDTTTPAHPQQGTERRACIPLFLLRLVRPHRRYPAPTTHRAAE